VTTGSGIDAAVAEMEKASRHLERHDGRLALGALDAAAAREPALVRDPVWWYMRAWSFAALDELDEALAAVDRGLALEPSHAPSLRTRSELLARRGDLAEAEEAVLAVLRIAPDNVDALAQYAEVLSRGGEHDAARATAERALAIDPEDPDALVARMHVAFAAGEPTPGRFAEAALRVDPGNPSALHMHSHDLAAKGRFEDARAAAAAAARQTPGATDVTAHARHLRRLDHWSMAPIRLMQRGDMWGWGAWLLAFVAGSAAAQNALGGIAGGALLFAYARGWPRLFDRLRSR
jgi:tetratricopeptide (TPR) repeat protein